MQFKTLSEAVVYSSNLEHILDEERQSERDRHFVRSVGEISNEDNKVAEDENHFVAFRNALSELDQCVRSLKDYQKGDKSNFVPDKKQKKVPVTDVKNSSESASNAVKRTPQNSPCHLCGELGHWRPRCPKLANQNAQHPLDEQKAENLN